MAFVPDQKQPKVSGRFVPDVAASPEPTQEKEPGLIDELIRRSTIGRIKSGNILYPDEESFVRKTVQSASSGPCMPAQPVQALGTGL